MKTWRLMAVVWALLSILVVSQAQSEPFISEALREHIHGLEASAQTIRALQAEQEIELSFPTREDLLAYLISVFDEEFTDEIAQEALLFYRAFGFLPADFDLRQAYLDLYQQQVAGFYEPDLKRMNVILFSGNGDVLGDRLPLFEQIIYVHEYVHALQDQYFDLQTYQAGYDANLEFDKALARAALVEGDATVVMNEYTRQMAEANPLGTLLQLATSGMDVSTLSLPPNTPPVLGAELLFPYETGAQFVSALFIEGGWDAVNEAYSNPPETTEQIYHPEKYLAGETALSVSLADQSSALGTSWQTVRSGLLGEFYLRQYLSAHLDSASVSLASSGWGGDAYHIYQSSGGQVAWHLALVWDTPQDAQEFETLLQQDASFRYANVSPEAVGEALCWVGPENTLCAQFGAETRLSVAPTLELAEVLQN